MRYLVVSVTFCVFLASGCSKSTTVIQGIVPSAKASTTSAASQTGILANGTTTSTITVQVKTATGDPLAGQVVELSATGSGNVLTQPATTTDLNGVATGTIASTTAETKTITAIINSGPTQVVVEQTVAVTFVIAPGDVSSTRSTVVASPVTGVVANGTQMTTLTVTVRDANDNPVSGQTVQFAVTGAGNTLAQPSATTDANGVATGTLASTTAETKSIFAVVNPGTVQVVLSQSPTVQFIADVANISAANSTVAVNPASNVVANGVLTVTITVTVRDANNNPVAGQTVQLVATGTVNTLTQPAGTSDAAGVVTGTIASTKAEVKTITATMNPGASQVVPTQTPTVTFIGDAANISTTLSTVAAAPTVVPGNGKAITSITVTVLDVNSNPIPAQVVQISSTGTNNTILQPTATTGSAGVAAGSIASTTAEVKTITATVNPGASQVVLSQTPTPRFASDLIDIGDARLYFGQGTGNQVLVQTFDDSALSWSSVSTTPAANATIKWVVNKFLPSGNLEQLLGVLSETVAGTDLDMLRWDGDGWTVDWSSTAILKANADKRGFDLEYENSSSDALVVYSNNSSNPVYRTRSGGTWSSEANVFATPPGTGDVYWVELASRKASNEIVLVYADAGSKLHAVIWTGSAWDETGTEITLSNTLSTVSDSKPFDAAYETTSGDLLVVWGHQYTTEEVQYAVKLAAASLWTITTLTTAQARAKVVDLAPDPGSNRIAAVLTEGIGDDDTVGMIWDGSSWVAIFEVDGGSVTTDRDAAIGWVGTSGTVVLVYEDLDSGSDIDWAKWTPMLGWSLQSDMFVSGMGNIQAVQMKSFGNQNKLMLLFSDTLSNLYAATYDGLNWVITNGGSPLNSTISSLNTQPFSFSIKN